VIAISILLPLHLVFVGLWIGCVSTEALFERALLGKGPAVELLLARLHRRVDLAVEIPAIFIVLVTGGLMVGQAQDSSALRAVAGFGLLAMAANAYCVWLVFQRRDKAAAGDWVGFARLDRQQHKIGALVLGAILAALAAGLVHGADVS